jgi:hypothetical protein
MFQKFVEGNVPLVQFEINGHQYDKGYYLTDDIYPRWSTLVKIIANPVYGGKKVWFARRKEVRDTNTHHQLQDDLVELLWIRKGPT